MTLVETKLRETNCADRVREQQNLRGGEMPVLTFAKCGEMIPFVLPQQPLTVRTVMIIYILLYKDEDKVLYTEARK